MNLRALQFAKRSLGMSGIASMFLVLTFVPAHAGTDHKKSAEANVGTMAGPKVSIENVTATEGTGGSTNFVFEVKVTNPNSNPVVVDFATSDGDAHGTPTGDFGDYATTSGTLVIPAFGTSGFLIVRVTADSYAEQDESFFVNLSNAQNADITDGEGRGRILDDDGTPVAGVDEGSIAEFALGRVTPTPSRGAARFEFALPRASRIRLAVLDLQGREVAVLAEGDYQAGRHQGAWDGRSGAQAASPGVYFLRYETPAGNRVTRIILER